MIALAEAFEYQLRELGERRARIDEERTRLADDTRRLVQRAHQRRANMSVVARLVGLERTYLYRHYLG